MLDKATVDKIIDFVHKKPRTVQEIAQFLQRNWRTANRYVDQVALETGLLATRTFREGSRGALKIVYARETSEKGSAYQESLLAKIIAGKRKEDFSCFDIYQFAAPDKRQAFIEHEEYPKSEKLSFSNFLVRAQRQVLFFSGNLSWIDMGPRGKVLRALEEAARRKVNIKILTKIDIVSRKNVERVLAINEHAGWNAIEIRHAEQPLRAVIVDDMLANLKEVYTPERYKPGELSAKTCLFYIIEDPEWVGWLQRVFWHIFGRSIDEKTRLEAIDSIRSA